MYNFLTFGKRGTSVLALSLMNTSELLVSNHNPSVYGPMCSVFHEVQLLNCDNLSFFFNCSKLIL